MGTDSGVGPHGNNLGELALMTGLGMPPLQAWRASTASAAELLGIDDEFGTLRPGKRADVVVLEGSAADLVDLRARVRAVYQDGILVGGEHARSLQAPALD